MRLLMIVEELKEKIVRIPLKRKKDTKPRQKQTPLEQKITAQEKALKDWLTEQDKLST